MLQQNLNSTDQQPPPQSALCVLHSGAPELYHLEETLKNLPGTLLENHHTNNIFSPKASTIAMQAVGQLLLCKVKSRNYFHITGKDAPNPKQKDQGRT